MSTTPSQPKPKPTPKPSSPWQAFLACCGCVAPPEASGDLHEMAKVAAAADGSSAPGAPDAAAGSSTGLTAGGAARRTPSVSDPRHLLGPRAAEDVGKKCLVLDLDETLVHSSFKPVAEADFVVPVEIEGVMHNVYVLKRPGVDEFLERLGALFEVVVFTASLAIYADPVLDLLDRSRVVKWRLFREACVHHKGNYVKDLGLLGRPLKDVIILDNSPASYIFHLSNAVPISSWFSDQNDSELVDLIPFLEELRLVDDVATVLGNVPIETFED
ncbi:hypothetical protein HK405_014497 [Cladochytrium tenue]|nr:hypothetical protein HK405_014497 [Cladochytrium tenue]